MDCRQLYKTILTPVAEKRIHNRECPSCGKPKSKWTRRTDWTCCSVECTETFYKEHDVSVSWQGQRLKALRRDKYTCQMCGVKHSYYSERHKLDFEKEGGLVGDHIKPVCIGGDCFDLDNIQTLCIDCHKIKTKDDMKLIAEYRQVEKKHETNQVELIR